MEGITAAFKKNRFRKGREGESFLRLFISKQLIHGAATALLGIFVPIFLYQTSGEKFYVVGGYYALLSTLYVLVLPYSMKLMNKIGFSHSLVIAGAFSVLIYGTMFFLTPQNIWYLLPFLTFFIVGFRVFHWVPFHVDFAMFTLAGERGKQISLSFATVAFLGVLGPILAGFIIANAGYSALFGTAIFLLLAATISYAFVPETATKFTWSVKHTWKQFFSEKMRPAVIGEFANGAEVSINLVVWPIFLYAILNGNVFEIGAVSAIIVAVTILVQLFVGKKIDKGKNTKEKTLKVGSSLYAFGWILKIFVLSATHVFFVGLYHNVVKIFTQTPYNAIMYDLSAGQGKYIDEFTTVREMAHNSGRALCLVVVATLAIFIPIGWTFLIAAVASIALNLVYHTHLHHTH